MIYGIYHSAAGLAVQEYRQAIISNNLANADTPGFKPDRVAVIERPVESVERGDARARHRVYDGLSGGLFETPVYTEFKQGPLERTDAPLDVALLGRGFFRVGTPEGVRYTRDGRFTISPDGTLLTQSGEHPLLSASGTPIRIDPRSRDDVSIDTLGAVFQGSAEVGRLDVVDVSDSRSMTKVGGNLFECSEDAHSISAELRPGAVEQSAADPIGSLTQMIAAARAYELNASLISIQDATLSKVVNDVGRLG